MEDDSGSGDEPTSLGDENSVKISSTKGTDGHPRQGLVGDTSNQDSLPAPVLEDHNSQETDDDDEYDETDDKSTRNGRKPTLVDSAGVFVCRNCKFEELSTNKRKHGVKKCQQEKSQKWSCGKCDRTYDSYAQLIRHISRRIKCVSNGKRNPCKPPEPIFRYETQLLKNNNCFICLICKSEASVDKVLEHGDNKCQKECNKWKCGYCDLSYYTKRELYVHIKNRITRHTSKGKLNPCKPSKPQTHYETPVLIELGRFICLNCKYIVNAKNEAEHGEDKCQKVDSDEWKCEYCKFVTDTKTRLYNHILNLRKRILKGLPGTCPKPTPKRQTKTCGIVNVASNLSRMDDDADADENPNSTEHSSTAGQPHLCLVEDTTSSTSLPAPVLEDHSSLETDADDENDKTDNKSTKNGHKLKISKLLINAGVLICRNCKSEDLLTNKSKHGVEKCQSETSNKWSCRSCDRTHDKYVQLYEHIRKRIRSVSIGKPNPCEPPKPTFRFYSKMFKYLGSFICLICKSEASVDKVLEHGENKCQKETNDKWSCGKCYRTYSTKKQLYSHINRRCTFLYNGKPSPCVRSKPRFCYETPRLQKLGRFICLNCKYIVNAKNKAEHGEDKCQKVDSDEWRCEYCRFTTNTIKRLYLHVVTLRKRILNGLAGTCSTIRPSFIRYSKPKSNWHRIGVQCCSNCKYNVIKGKEDHHGIGVCKTQKSNEWKCGHCEKSFKFKISLRRHIAYYCKKLKNYDGKRKQLHSCPNCSYVGKSAILFAKHKRQRCPFDNNGKIRPKFNSYKLVKFCDKCKISVTNGHVCNNETGKSSKWTCSSCKESFDTYNRLQMHVAYKCKESCIHCSETLKYANRKPHLIGNCINIALFLCECCGYSTTNKNDKTNHIRSCPGVNAVDETLDIDTGNADDTVTLERMEVDGEADKNATFTEGRPFLCLVDDTRALGSMPAPSLENQNSSEMEVDEASGKIVISAHSIAGQPRLVLVNDTSSPVTLPAPVLDSMQQIDPKNGDKQQAKESAFEEAPTTRFRDSGLFICPNCKIDDLKTRSYLHGKGKCQFSNIEVYICSKCGFSSRNKCSFQLHALRHLEFGSSSVPSLQSLYPCDLCFYLFPNSEEITMHYESKHRKMIKVGESVSTQSVPKFKCYRCNQGFDNKNNAIIHMMACKK